MVNSLFFQVDSSKRLAELCGISSEKGSANCMCAIVTRGQDGPLVTDEDPPLSAAERQLTEFYECTLEEFPRPVIQLPI